MESSIFVELINLDTKTLISVLVWGNFILASLTYLFRITNKASYDKAYIKRLLITRILQVISSFLLFTRGYFIDFISVNIGNTLYFISFYFESCLLLTLSETKNKKIYLYVKYITIAMIINFNLLDFIFRQPSLRVVSASTTIILIFIIPTVNLIFSKPVITYKRAIGILYLFLVSLLLPRTIMPLFDNTINILSSNIIQTLTFLSFLLIAISSTAVFLFIMKDDMDNKIKEMATTDSLTCISNRHSFINDALIFFNIFKASKKNLTLLFFDIDYFKKINDEYGHSFGDEVLIRFAKIIRSNIRPNDLSCRYGGEEFIVILSTDEPSLGPIVCKRIMNEIDETRIEAYPDFKVTTSIGVVTEVPKENETLQDFISRGDKALYRAKDTGRNKMVTYDENIDRI